MNQELGNLVAADLETHVKVLDPVSLPSGARHNNCLGGKSLLKCLVVPATLVSEQVVAPLIIVAPLTFCFNEHLSSIVKIWY